MTFEQPNYDIANNPTYQLPADVRLHSGNHQLVALGDGVIDGTPFGLPSEKSLDGKTVPVCLKAVVRIGVDSDEKVLAVTEEGGDWFMRGIKPNPNTKGYDIGSSIQLRPGDEYILGRRANTGSSDERLLPAKDLWGGEVYGPSISSQHLGVVVSVDGVFNIIDRGSTNGSRLILPADNPYASGHEQQPPTKDGLPQPVIEMVGRAVLPTPELSTTNPNVDHISAMSPAERIEAASEAITKMIKPDKDPASAAELLGSLWREGFTDATSLDTMMQQLSANMQPLDDSVLSFAGLTQLKAQIRDVLQLGRTPTGAIRSTDIPHQRDLIANTLTTVGRHIASNPDWYTEKIQSRDSSAAGLMGILYNTVAPTFKAVQSLQGQPRGQDAASYVLDAVRSQS